MFYFLKGTCNHSVENALKSLKFPHAIQDRMLWNVYFWFNFIRMLYIIKLILKHTFSLTMGAAIVALFTKNSRRVTRENAWVWRTVHNSQRYRRCATCKHKHSDMIWVVFLSCDNEMHGCQAYGCQNKAREGWVKGKRLFQMPINSLRSASWRWNGSTILVRVVRWKNSISTGKWFARTMSPLIWNTGWLDWVKDDCWTKVLYPLNVCTERKVRGRRVGVVMAREERSRKRDEHNVRKYYKWGTIISFNVFLL